MDKEEYFEVVLDNIESTMESVKADYVFIWSWKKTGKLSPKIVKWNAEIREFIRNEDAVGQLIFVSYENPGWTTYGYYHDMGLIRPITVTDLMKYYDRIYTSLRLNGVSDEFKIKNPILYDIFGHTRLKRKDLAKFTFYEIYGVEDYIEEKYKYMHQYQKDREVCDMFFNDHMEYLDIVEKTGVPYYEVNTIVYTLRPIYDSKLDSTLDYKLFLELYDNALPMNIYKMVNKAFDMRYNKSKSLIDISSALHINKATLTKVMSLKYGQAKYYEH